MCFFNAQNRRALEIAKRYGRRSDIVEMAAEILGEQRREQGSSEADDYIPGGMEVQKAFLNPDCWIVARNVEMLTAKWGLIPFWVDDVKKAENIRNMTANARAETVFTQASFRNAIRKRRCLVPSTGFFEYHYVGKEATPYRIFLPDMDIFSLAGIYEEWKNPLTKEMVRTFSVVTVPANELCGFIHNGGRHPGRMPGIITVEEESRWLDPEATEEEVMGMLRPYEGRMEAVEMAKDYLRRA